MQNVPKINVQSNWLTLKSGCVWCRFRSFAEASTLGHALGRGSLHHLLVLADEFGQVVSDGNVEPRDGTAPEVRARRRQLLELEQGIQPEEVTVRLGVGQVVPVQHTDINHNSTSDHQRVWYESTDSFFRLSFLLFVSGHTHNFSPASN